MSQPFLRRRIIAFGVWSVRAVEAYWCAMDRAARNYEALGVILWANIAKPAQMKIGPFVVCASLLVSWKGLGSPSVASTLDRWPHDWFRLAVTGCAGSDARANR